MNHVKVFTKTYTDNSARYIELPSLLIEQNGEIKVFEQLLKYQLKYKYKSNTWHNQLIQTVGLLFDYLNANPNNYTSAKEFFELFAEAMYSGTIDEEGNDSSGLYWLPKRPKTANTLLTSLSDFSDWLYKNYRTEQLNPWREATRYEERLKWMALINRSERSFLGHLDDVYNISETAKIVRNVISHRTPYAVRNGSKIFPEEHIEKLLREGFKKTRKGYELDIVDGYNWRDIAITLLMHYGGLRHSEPFHLWIQDVVPDPDDPDMAIVRIYHPSEGKTPRDFKNPNTGKYVTDRASYLKLKYGLLPRNQYSSRNKRFAGWKNPRLDDEENMYMNVYWFPQEAGYVFMYVWKKYLKQRIRNGIKDTHPFAFVSFDPRYLGEMMSVRTQTESHNKACEIIGLEVSKYNGTTNHGHRHSYGQRMKNAGIDKKVRQAAMHHKSEESQIVYTEPTVAEVTSALASATASLNQGKTLPMKSEIGSWYEEEKKLAKKYMMRKK